MTRPRTGYVPLSIRTRSRVVTWLWRRGRFTYDQAKRLARWLP